MTLGEKIKYYRKKSGLTQKAFATLLNMATGTIQQYELGKRQPRLETLEKISEVLNIHPYELYSEDDFIAESEREWKTFKELDDEILILLYRIYGNVQRKTVHADNAPPNVINEASYYVIGKKGKEFYLFENDIDDIRQQVKEKIEHVIYLIQKKNPDIENELKQWILYDMEGEETVNNSYRLMKDLQKKERTQNLKPLEESIKKELEEYFRKLESGASKQ